VTPRKAGKAQIRAGLRALEDVGEIIASLGRADEGGPAKAISEHRPNDLTPNRRAHIAKFIQDNSIQVVAAQPGVVYHINTPQACVA
jgi:hypothetical protein